MLVDPLKFKKKKKKKETSVYAGRELILRRDLNLRPSEDNTATRRTSSKPSTYV